MYKQAPCVYGVKLQARCLVAQESEKDRHRFFVGTNAVRQNNTVHLIEYDEDKNEFAQVNIYQHENEVWSISPSPFDASLLFTSHRSGDGKKGATLWRAPSASTGYEDNAHVTQEATSSPGATHGGSVKQMTQLASIPANDCKTVLWEPHDDVEPHSSSATTHKVISVHNDGLKVWDLATADFSMQDVAGIQTSTFGADDKENGGSNILNTEKENISCAGWDPHEQNCIAMGVGRAVAIWDVRTSKLAAQIRKAHLDRVLDLDYNPNKPHTIVTSGDDCEARFWDVRRPQEPLKALRGHSHWVSQVKYNRFHDQLVATAGTDAIVNLWRVSSVSSSPLTDLDDEQRSVPVEDTKVRSFDEHEDSVYSIAWSASSAWVFASLSYDGRVVMNHVPSTEKYKILL